MSFLDMFDEDEIRVIVALVAFKALLSDPSASNAISVSKFAWNASDAFMAESKKRLKKEEEKNGQ